MADKFVNARDLVQKAMARLWKYAGEGRSCAPELQVSSPRPYTPAMQIYSSVAYVCSFVICLFSSTMPELLQGHLAPECSGQH